MDALKKAEKELDAEMFRQIDLIYTSTAIAFCRHWSWGAKRIKGLFDETTKTWGECSSTNEMSMLQMLEEETGIELKRPDSDKSWHELAFLNAKIDLGDMSRAQIIYMRQQQKKWIGCQVLACLFLSLYRKYDFGAKRLYRLMGQIYDIRNEFSWDRKALLKACDDETGIQIVEGEAI